MFGDNNNGFAPSGPDQGFVQQGWSSDTQQAVLYVFRPRTFTPQVRRPHTYEFDTNFAADLQEAIYTQARSGLMNHNKMSYLTGSEAANKAIIPAATGLDIQCQRLSDYWTFVLIIDNDAPNTGRARPLKLNNRLVYWGICIDEPINAQAMWGGTTPNPNCVLEITHQTVLGIEQQSDSTGIWERAAPVVDNDIIRPSMVGTLSPESEYLLTPGVVFDASIPQGGGSFITSTTRSQLNLQDTIAVDSLMNSPREHLKDVVYAAMAVAKESAMGEEEVSPAFRDGVTIQIDTETNRDRFRNHINYAAPTPMLGIDTSRPITIAELRQHYNNLQVEEVAMPTEMPVDVQYQGAATPTNIFGSIINSSLPAMMANVGLSEVSFRYASRTTTAFVRDAPPEVKVNEVIPYIPEHPEHTRKRWWHLYERLQQHLFPMMLANVGHFDLTVQCQITGVCMIQLQLLDMGEYNDGYLVDNQILGGAAMPVIGTHANLLHNSTTLNNTIGVVLADTIHI